MRFVLTRQTIFPDVKNSRRSLGLNFLAEIEHLTKTIQDTHTPFFSYRHSCLSSMG